MSDYAIKKAFVDNVAYNESGEVIGHVTQIREHTPMVADASFDVTIALIKPLANPWEDIASAPKDGSVLFAWCDRSRLLLLCWYSSKDKCFLTESDEESIECNPTHWLPHPPPPEAEA
jgi:hypothetical protein